MKSVTKGAAAIAYEILRLMLRHPVLGIQAVPIDPEGRIVMMRRRDTGTWCLPGGAVDWGEPLAEALRRELREETGRDLLEVVRIVGIYSDPARDPRMHAVCVLVEARVAGAPAAGEALNPLEVADVRAFAEAEIPGELAFDSRRMLDDWRRRAPALLA